MYKIAGKAKNYKVKGEAKDQEWIIAHKEELIEGLFNDMRDHGFVPIIDATPEVKWEYNAERSTMNFVMIAKGYRVGKAKSKELSGILLSQGLLLDAEGNGVSLVELD